MRCRPGAGLRRTVQRVWMPRWQRSRVQNCPGEGGSWHARVSSTPSRPWSAPRRELPPMAWLAGLPDERLPAARAAWSPCGGGCWLRCILRQAVPGAEPDTAAGGWAVRPRRIKHPPAGMFRPDLTDRMGSVLAASALSAGRQSAARQSAARTQPAGLPLACWKAVTSHHSRALRACLSAARTSTEPAFAPRAGLSTTRRRTPHTHQAAVCPTDGSPAPARPPSSWHERVGMSVPRPPIRAIPAVCRTHLCRAWSITSNRRCG